jgi:HAD superfamily hydrolase (TIGR01509 family)
MRQTVKAVLCDIDGTLVQSNWLHAAAWKSAFAEIGIALDLEDVRRQIGKGGDELIPVFVPWWKRKPIEQPLKAYRKYLFHADYLSQVRPFPEVRDLLLRMKAAGIRIAIASSAAEDEIAIYLKIANIADLVEKTASAADADHSKPHPDIFQASLQQLDLKPSEVLALGDTPYDAEAAGKAGIWTVGVTSGGWTSEELMAAGCIEVYKDVSDLHGNFEHSVFGRSLARLSV